MPVTVIGNSNSQQLIPNFSSGSPSSIDCVDSSKVFQWLRKYDDALPRFEKISNNGLNSILKKEVLDITSLLKEGEVIGSSSVQIDPKSDMINQLVKPRLGHLQKECFNAQKRISEQSERTEDDEKLEKKWESLGLPRSVLEYHSDCARFLVDSGLAFAIVGYRQTCNDANLHDVKLDIDGHPLIKMQGHFVRWETIAKQLQYDPKTRKIKSRDYSGNIVQSWNYFHSQGLEPRDRFKYGKVFDIYELPADEYNRLLTISKKFYENNPEKDIGVAKDCIVQFFTSPRRQGVPEHPLLENLYKTIPVHIGIRLITSDKKVYSFGYEMPLEEQSFVLSDYFSTFFATAEANVCMRDYEEFRDHEGRIVTSIPLSSQRSKNILDFLNSIKDKQLRFQFARQNCTALMQEVIKRAGYEVNIRTTIAAALLDLLPNLNQLPLIGKTIGKVETFAARFWEMLPEWIGKPFNWCKATLLYLPQKAGTVMANLLTLKMGAAKKTTPLREGEEEELYDKKGIQQFSSVIRSWKDLFKDETSAINHSKYFIDWQNKQKSTFFVPPSDQPKLAILPSVT